MRQRRTDGAIRSIEGLVRDYPNKTGAEILKLQEQDKEDAKKWQEERYKEMYQEAERLRKGKYFAIFWNTMVYYIRIDKVEYEAGGDIRIDGVETVIHDVRHLTKGGLNIETLREFGYKEWRTYYSDDMKVLTEKEWDEVHEKINNLYKEARELFGKHE